MKEKIKNIIIILLLFVISLLLVKKVSADYQRLKEAGYINLWSKTNSNKEWEWSPMWIIYDDVENINCYVTKSAIKCLPATK